ncbi:hypothetical protein GCM10010399_54060 [Dactylosporangium fulvum]|uniref:Uncharacterized protein n=1 Tax=Dactylosporangium fulvum TaxID=53359 RepID=A0ABY5WD08_9ACTN|nr:hypothetical protein [Dactylosporangium fulvum]UWP87231.1 hypothetical protein Dfulv_24505 [Dactylosporangium fulvum]
MLQLVALLATTIPVLLVSAGPASAGSGCPRHDGSSRCYARGVLNQYDNLHAIGADLYVNCLHVEDRRRDFINLEMWLRTQVNTSIPAWVEIGMTAGTLTYSPGKEQGFIWFWADNVGAAYYEHYIGPAYVRTWTNVSFYWEGNGWWGVYNGGRRVGGSSVGAYPGVASIGAEATTDRVALDGSARNWMYRDRVQGIWGTVSPNRSIEGDPLVLNASVGSGSVAAWTPRWACGGPPPSSATETDASLPGTAREALPAVARRLAGVAGDAAPGAMRFVQSTRREAARSVMSAEVDTDEPVYVVEVDGTFSRRALQGTTSVTGTKLIAVVEANTGRVLDWGTTKAASSLSKLGAPVALS